MMKTSVTIVIVGLILLGCHARRLDESTPPVVRAVTVNGAELSYVADGQGETVIFLHGIGTDLRIWDGVRPYIARKYRFVAYSQRHHVPNTWSDSGDSHTIAQHAEDLAAFIKALGVERAHIVGASLGGRILGTMANRYSQLVASMVLNDSVLALPEDEDSKRLMKPFFDGFSSFAAAAREGKREEAAVALVEWLSDRSDAWNGLPARRKQYYLDNAATLALIIRDRTPRPTCSALRALQVPALVMAGESTPLGLRLSNRRLSDECLKDAPYRVVPDADHFWYATNPHGGAEIILDFLGRHPIGDGRPGR